MAALEDPPVPSVPFWALTLVADVAAIKASTAAIPKIDKELDDLRRESVPMREHNQLMKRSDALWNAYQRMKGILWLMGLIEASLTLVLAARIGHLI